MTDEQEQQGGKGTPTWMPFAALLLTFVILVIAGTQIFPSLMGLVFPPEPPVPADTSKLIEHTVIGPGADEWRYSSSLTGCEMAKYVQDRIGGCVYDPSSQCSEDTKLPGPTGGSYPIARCVGIQTTGVTSYRWLIQITTGNQPVEEQTRVRIYREATNRQQ